MQEKNEALLRILNILELKRFWNLIKNTYFYIDIKQNEDLSS